MSEERLQEIRDSIEFQYTLAKAKGYDNALLFTNEEEELIEEIERLNNIINEFDKWLDEESEKTILSTGHLTCLMMCKNKLQELKGSNSNENL